MCGTFRGKAGHSGDSSSSVAFSVTRIEFFPSADSLPRKPKGLRDCGLRAAVLLPRALFGPPEPSGGNSPFLPLPPPFHHPGFCSVWALNVFWDQHFLWEGAGRGWSPAPGLMQPREFGVSPGAAHLQPSCPGPQGPYKYLRKLFPHCSVWRVPWDLGGCRRTFPPVLPVSPTMRVQ